MRVDTSKFEVSNEVKAWLHRNFDVRITSRGFDIYKKGSSNKIAHRNRWVGVLKWARDRRAASLRRRESNFNAAD